MVPLALPNLFRFSTHPRVWCPHPAHLVSLVQEFMAHCPQIASYNARSLFALVSILKSCPTRLKYWEMPSVFPSEPIRFIFLEYMAFVYTKNTTTVPATVMRD